MSVSLIESLQLDLKYRVPGTYYVVLADCALICCLVVFSSLFSNWNVFPRFPFLLSPEDISCPDPVPRVHGTFTYLRGYMAAGRPGGLLVVALECY